MGKITWKDEARLTLSLVGNFRLLDPEGREIRLSEKKGRVLLAMLATARDRRRSRDWLKTRLWGRSFEPQASNSLRQCLHALRKSLAPFDDALQADYEHVWLAGFDIQLDPDSDTRTEFFEDAPALDEDGEDWLREERQAYHARVVDTGRAMVDVGQTTRLAPFEPSIRPCVLIGSPVVISEDPRAAAVAERITSAIEATFRHDGYVDTFDLRDMQTNQFEHVSFESAVRPPVLVEVRVSLIGTELQATLVARVPATGRVLWTSSIASDTDAAFAIASETMSEFIMGAVDSIEAIILRQPGTSVKPTLYTG